VVCIRWGCFRTAGAGRSGTARYRDDVRRFLRADLGMAGELATAPVRQRRPLRAHGRHRHHSVTSSPATTASRSGTSSAHNHKHNEANGEDNRDGLG